MDLTSYLVNVGMSMAQTRNQVSYNIAVMGKAMDVQDMEAAALGEMLSQPVQVPSFGHRMDIRV